MKEEASKQYHGKRVVIVTAFGVHNATQVATYQRELLSRENHTEGCHIYEAFRTRGSDDVGVDALGGGDHGGGTSGGGGSSGGGGGGTSGSGGSSGGGGGGGGDGGGAANKNGGGGGSALGPGRRRTSWLKYGRLKGGGGGGGGGGGKGGKGARGGEKGRTRAEGEKEGRGAEGVKVSGGGGGRGEGGRRGGTAEGAGSTAGVVVPAVPMPLVFLFQSNPFRPDDSRDGWVSKMHRKQRQEVKASIWDGVTKAGKRADEDHGDIIGVGDGGGGGGDIGVFLIDDGASLHGALSCSQNRRDSLLRARQDRRGQDALAPARARGLRRRVLF
ncbi:unnamed protein product, partial [Laminaria digitata]